jgi:hypothetical protein
MLKAKNGENISAIRSSAFSMTEKDTPDADADADACRTF